jgi:sialic acid synthase SpsE
MENNQSTLIEFIAEVGSNYDNDFDNARAYIKAAQANGATAVKFQTLLKQKLIAPLVRSEQGLKRHPAWDGFSNLELSDDWHFELKHYSDDIGIEFLSTPFYLEAVDLLERVGVNRYKISSGDITFQPLLERVGATGKPVLLSTGGSTLEDVEQAIKVLNSFGGGPVTLLHCVVSYPPNFEEMNLRALETMKKRFGLAVGISDHSPGSIVPLGAVALGATVIEKHVTFDRSLSGPDHSFAMTMTEFSDMISDVRKLEKALGKGDKKPSKDEKDWQHRYRRGIYDPMTYEPTKSNQGIWLRPEHKNLF